MYRSHSTLGEREVPVRDFTAGPERPKVVRVITRLNIGGPTIHTLLLTREMAALEYRTVLVAGGHAQGSRRGQDHYARARTVREMRHRVVGLLAPGQVRSRRSRLPARLAAAASLRLRLRGLAAGQVLNRRGP